MTAAMGLRSADVITLADVADLPRMCMTACCLAHRRSVWTGGDQERWVHADGWECAGIDGRPIAAVL